MIYFSIVCLRLLIYATENLKSKKKGRYSHWQCIQYLDLNPTCAVATNEYTCHSLSKYCQRALDVKEENETELS